jgi:signal transduction histidine kinase
LQWTLAALWLAAVTSVLAWSESRPGIADQALAAGNFLLGIGFAVTAVLLSNQEGQKGNARLFALLATVWTAGEAGIRGLGAVTPLAIWVGGFTQIIAGAVLLRYPGQRLDRAGRAFVLVVSVLLGAIQAGLIVTATPQTWEEPIPDAPWPTLWLSDEVNDALWKTRYAVWSVGGVVFLALLARRWRRLSSVARRTLAPILVTAAATGFLIALRPVDDSLPDSVALVLATARTYSATAVSAAFVLSALQMQLARGAVGDLATELSHSVSVERVRDALRHALSDPTLEVWYWVSDQGGYVGGDGRVRPLPDRTERLVAEAVTADGEPLAAVLADPALYRHRGLVDSAVAVSRLALENAQLQASLRSQLVAVREARARLLHTSLEQRRRLERDLHDGAQQRLLALGMRLGAIENDSTDPTTSKAIESARHELHQALEELRDLAHGLYPAVLTQAGLPAALEAVIERLPFRVHATVAPERWHPDVESAAYLISCEALANAWKHAGPCTIDLDIHRKGDDLVIRVCDDGIGSAQLSNGASLRAIHDRVDAMGGRVAVESRPGDGTCLTAAIPCV